MLSSAAQALSEIVGEICRRLFRLPKTWWYGLSAGLVSAVPSVIWSLLVASNEIDDRVFASMNPLLQAILTWGIDLAPVILIIAAGVRLGSRSGRVREGVVAGAVGGGVYAIVNTVCDLVHGIVYVLSVAAPAVIVYPMGARFRGKLLVVAVIVCADLVLGVICIGVGAGLGALGAFAGCRWRRRRQAAWHEARNESWHESAALAISAISSISDGSLAAMRGDE